MDWTAQNYNNLKPNTCYPGCEQGYKTLEDFQEYLLEDHREALEIIAWLQGCFKKGMELTSTIGSGEVNNQRWHLSVISQAPSLDIDSALGCRGAWGSLPLSRLALGLIVSGQDKYHAGSSAFYVSVDDKAALFAPELTVRFMSWTHFAIFAGSRLG